MSKLLKLSVLALFVAVGAFAFVGMNPGVVAAQDQEEQAEQTEDQAEETSANVYSYTAQPGDSYTKIARKAVQTFGIIKEVNLSQAQIIAAETYLTLGSGSPLLNAGDKVEVKEADVDAAVKKAQALTEAQQALWQRYVAGVNFNTDKVGQA